MLDPRTARTNRYALAAIGTAVVAGGLFVIGQSQSLWLASTARDPLLTGSETRYLHAHTWLWILAAVIATLAVLGCSRWVLDQTRRADVATLSLEADPAQGQTTLSARVIARAIQADLSRHPDIDHAHVEISGQPGDPTVRITASLSDPHRVSSLRDYVSTDITRNIREILDLPDDPPVYLTVAIGSRGSI